MVKKFFLHNMGPLSNTCSLLSNYFLELKQKTVSCVWDRILTQPPAIISAYKAMESSLLVNLSRTKSFIYLTQTHSKHEARNAFWVNVHKQVIFLFHPSNVYFNFKINYVVFCFYFRVELLLLPCVVSDLIKNG